MKRCTTVIEWLTCADGDFQCKENFNESAVRQSLKADRSPSILLMMRCTTVIKRLFTIAGNY